MVTLTSADIKEAREFTLLIPTTRTGEVLHPIAKMYLKEPSFSKLFKFKFKYTIMQNESKRKAEEAITKKGMPILNIGSIFTFPNKKADGKHIMKLMVVVMTTKNTSRSFTTQVLQHVCSKLVEKVYTTPVVNVALPIPDIKGASLTHRKATLDAFIEGLHKSPTSFTIYLDDELMKYAKKKYPAYLAN